MCVLVVSRATKTYSTLQGEEEGKERRRKRGECVIEAQGQRAAMQCNE